MEGCEVENADQCSYDVFIAYKTSSDKDLALHIAKALETQKKRVLADWVDGAIPSGKFTVESIIRCIEKSEKTLVILSSQSIESNWVLFELMEAIEKSKRSNVLTLRILLHNVKKHQIRFMKCGMLAEVPHFTLDFNSEGWPQELLHNITNKVPLSNIISAGSGLAHGLVFSHFVGFLSFVLPVLKEKIEESEIYKEDNVKLGFSKKYYLVLPGSCEIMDNLESNDSAENISINMVDSIRFIAGHVGKPREFTLTVYKISRETEKWGTETYYFIADLPHVLKTICQLHELEEADRRFQIARFYYVINQVVNHAENQSCSDIVRLILYNENEESLQSALFKCIRNDIPTQLLQEVSLDPKWQSPMRRLMSTIPAEADYDATILFSNDQDRDREVAVQISEFLKKENMKVFLPTDTSGPQFHLPSAKWHIFVLSEASLFKDEIVKAHCFGTLYDSFDDNVLRVLPVVVDIEPEKVPRVIKCVTLVKANEPSYCQQLLNTMKGGNIRMEQALPAGNVATGLAWALVNNYLRITLLKRTKHGLDLKDRIKACLEKNNIKDGCIHTLFTITPHSCVVESDLAVNANTSRDSDEYSIEFIDSLEPVFANTGGQVKRSFRLRMYRYTEKTSGKSICFLAEYSTSHYCLQQMAYNYSFAGLTKDEMVVQGKRIIELVPHIINHEKVIDKYGDMTKLFEFIYYDDEKESLMSAIRKHIKGSSRILLYA